MSVICIIVPVVIGGWPVVSAVAAAAAAGLGFKLMKRTEVQEEKDVTNEVQITDEKSQIIEEALKPEEELVFTKDDITLTLKKDVHERLTICVKGINRSNEELNKIGKQFLNKIKQQYAYQKIKEEITKRGFNIVQETTEERRIKLVLRKY